jgi:Zn-dependent protease with chaperone function/uncharacterized tellurite resistance protein B-like protein
MHFIVSLLKVLFIGLAIPSIGAFTSFYIINDMDGELAKEGLPSHSILCKNNAILDIQGMKAVCEQYDQISLLGDASIIVALFSIALPVLYILCSRIAGTNRSLVALIFPPLVFISLLLISVMVLLQGAILTYSAYIGEIFLIERVHYILIGAIGLGALFACITLISSSFGLTSKLTSRVFGKSLSIEDAPNLYAFVTELAETLGASPPKNIVLGLEPTFFVTNSDVRVTGEAKTLKGETLFLSAPLTRLMSKMELSAVVGHELGHFRGDDTVFSMRFAPVYTGLGNAIQTLSNDDDDGSPLVAAIPALVMLSFMHEVFSRNEKAIGRQRELLADQAGAEVSSPISLATSLAKVVLYSQLWNVAKRQNLTRLNQGKVTQNLSEVFQDLAKFDVEHNAIEDILTQILDKSIPHPTDTHPSLGSRFASLNIDQEMISKESLMIPKESAIEVIDNYSALEEELTQLEHQFWAAIGAIEFPQDGEETEDNYILRVTYCLAAQMVIADGVIEPEEITVAEDIGREIFGTEFDPIDFRRLCNNPDDIPELEMIIELMDEVLDDKGKVLILRYLKAISESDNDVSETETNLLKQVMNGWSIEMKELEG